MEKIKGQQILGYKFSGEGSKTFAGANPKTGDKLSPNFFEATTKEVDAAVQLAEKAFTVYSKKSGEEKAAFLDKIAEEILALGDDLIAHCGNETALPQARLVGERGRTVNQLKLFAQLLREGSWTEARIDNALPDRTPPRPDVRQMLMPIGPVGIFGASNFPLAFSVAGGDTASALAAGCTVVVKGHPAHPITSELIGRAIIKAAQETGMPEGVFSLIHGISTEVGMAIVNHPLIKAIGFTGSFRGGKAIFDAANKRPEPIPVYAEMGSTNPVFILPHALSEKGETIAQGLAASVIQGVGQFCTNPGVFVTMDSPKTADFIQATGKVLADCTAGTMLTGGINKAYTSGIEKLSKISGVSVLSKGKVNPGPNEAPAHIFQTTAETVIKNPEIAEEVFGPSTVGITAKNKEELLKLASSFAGHLTATLHGTKEDLESHRDLIEILERKVGRLIINGYPTGVEVSHAMHHGGPYPASTDSRTTSVGTAAIKRFVRPICYQDFPAYLLPKELQDENPLKIMRLVDGQWNR